MRIGKSIALNVVDKRRERVQIVSMKHPFTQSELSAFASEGNTVILSFRSAAMLIFSVGVGEMVLSPLPKKYSGMPFTKRGRVIATTPAEFQKALSF